MAKALIIDDEASLVTMIGRFLDGAGFEVEGATSGQEGLQKAASGLPDVVILDVMMPGMDGYEVCRRLRRDPRTARSTVLMLTARGQPIDKEMAFRSGADAHITKPFKGKELVLTVRHLMAAKPRGQCPKGHQVLVLRLKGRAGATTLVTNLALSMTKATGCVVVAADLVLRGGQVGEMLGLPPSEPWVSLVSDGSLSAPELISCLVRHHSGLFTLPAPRLAPEVALPPPAVAAQLTNMLRSWHDYVLLDAPLDLGDLAAVVLESPLILLLLTPEQAALHTARITLTAFKKLGYNSSQVWPVLNMVTPEHREFGLQVKQVLGLPVVAALPWSPEECARATAERTPVVLGQSKSVLAVAIQTLAQKVARAAVTQPQKGTPT